MYAKIISIVMLLATAASAQVIYEPTQYQYGDGHRVFYYGGTNSCVIAHGYCNAWLARGTPLPPAVYIDALPLRNARDYGFTPDDAHNEARMAIPRYFVKEELLSDARADRLDGSSMPGQ